MANVIKGFDIDGTVYKYDYLALEHIPLPVVTSADNGKIIGVDSSGNLVAMDVNLSSVNQEIASIKQRLLALENSTNTASVSGNKLII